MPRSTPAPVPLSPSLDQPAVADQATAMAYVGGRSRLFCLIYRGYLEPFTTGHRNVSFLQRDLDTALRIAKMNGDQLNDLPRDVGSVSAAMAAHRRLAELDQAG